MKCLKKIVASSDEFTEIRDVISRYDTLVGIQSVINCKTAYNKIF